jgi:dTDP-glucose 4,6-dehydratase
MQCDRITVTGRTGFLGSHLFEHLRYYSCTGTSGNLEYLAERAVPAGPLRRHRLHPPARYGPRRVNFASRVAPMDYLRLPIETPKVGSLGTLHAVGLATEKDARFLLASTSETYGDPQVHPQPESYWGHVNRVDPRGVYDEAKRFTEALTMAYRRAHGVDAAIVRMFDTFGPRMRPDNGRAIPTFIRQALRGEPLTVAGDGSQTRSICYVDDLVEGIVRLLCSELPGPVNIGNPHELSVLALAETIRDLTGSASPITFIDRPRRRPHRPPARRHPWPAPPWAGSRTCP